MKIYFTYNAWCKQWALLNKFDTEIAWHGLMRPIEGGYEVYDILVYPQEVTGGTVETDQVKYQTWLMDQPDEVFNHIRYQGHSHVNMMPYASGTDEVNQERLVAQLPQDGFYLFMIWNKQGYYTATLYDHGTMYDEHQIKLSTENPYAGFVEQARSLLTEKVYKVKEVYHELEQKP